LYEEALKYQDEEDGSFSDNATKDQGDIASEEESEGAFQWTFDLAKTEVCREAVIKRLCAKYDDVARFENNPDSVEEERQVDKIYKYFEVPFMEGLRKDRQSIQFHYAIYIWRRCTLIYCVFGLNWFPLLQIAIVVKSNFICFLYQVTMRPYEDEELNSVEAFNEVIIYLCSFHWLILMQSTSPEFEENLGWSLIFVLCFNILYHMFTLMKQLLGNAKESFKEKYQQFKMWDQLERCPCKCSVCGTYPAMDEPLDFEIDLQDCEGSSSSHKTMMFCFSIKGKSKANQSGGKEGEQAERSMKQQRYTHWLEKGKFDELGKHGRARERKGFEASKKFEYIPSKPRSTKVVRFRSFVSSRSGTEELASEKDSLRSRFKRRVNGKKVFVRLSEDQRGGSATRIQEIGELINDFVKITRKITRTEPKIEVEMLD